VSQYTQQNGINSLRNQLDDQYDGKTVFQFQPLQGLQDGNNQVFQIPQSRVVVNPPPPATATVFPQIYVNNAALVFNTDYTVLNAKQGVVQFTAGKQPKPEDSVAVTFNWTWFDDIELDRHLTKGANEVGLTTYYVTPPTVVGTDAIPAGGSQPTDVPDGLFNALTLIAAGLACRALANRFSMKFDYGAGDMNYSPSQMAKAFTELGNNFEKRGYNARDDFYKSQGRQYQPITDGSVGYVLPNWTPAR